MRRNRAAWLRAVAVLREATAMSRSSPVPSLASIVIIAGLCVAVLLTTGRTVGAQDKILSRIDSEGTRAITVRATADAGLRATVLSRLRALEGVETVTAFGPSNDVHNASIPSGNSVSIRNAWGSDLERLGVESVPSSVQPEAWASAEALHTLGMEAPAGSLSGADGASFSVVGQVRVPSELSQLEPLIIFPRSSSWDGEVAVLVIVAKRATDVSGLIQPVVSMLGVSDPSKISVSTSQSLVRLRSLVDDQLGTLNSALLASTFVVTATLVTSILSGFVLLRRRDFGRRRALGASRGLVIALVVLQTGEVAVIGVFAGTLVALATLTVQGAPLPRASFVMALDYLAVLVSLAASLVPGWIASRRDPMRELRVP